MVLDIKL